MPAVGVSYKNKLMVVRPQTFIAVPQRKQQQLQQIMNEIIIQKK